MVKKMQKKCFEEIRGGLEEVIDSFEKGRKLTCREVSLPEPPRGLTGKDIADLRKKKLNVSQHIFAFLLNVSPRTIQAWEQNINTPSGPALRMLWLLQKSPDILKFMLP
jgi:putative transcriptional regulator